MSSSTEVFAPLCNFLKTASLDKITISRIFTQQWKLFKIQSKEEDCKCLMNILKSVESNIKNKERRQHIIVLQDINRINYTHDKLISLIDAGELKGNFKEYKDWKNEASNNIAILKSAFENGGTRSHDHIYAKLCGVKVNDLLQNDPLCGEKGDIKDLTKSAGIKKICTDFVVRRNELSQFRKLVLSQSEIITHNQWIEEEYGKERAVRDIIDVLLQEIKLNALRKVTRAECQNIASKNRKVQQQKGSRGNKPDLMIRMFVHKKWEEIVYLESGKWNCNDEKIRSLNKNYIGFGVNIAGKYIEIHGLIRENGIKYYLPISRAKIPFEDESVDEVEEFVHALLILRLAAENDILRRENTEIKSENIELKAENVKLKQSLEEHESRFIKLEQNDKDTASENAELKARVVKLEQKQLQSGNSIAKSGNNTKVIDLSSTYPETDSSHYVTASGNDTPATNISDDTSNPDVCHESPSQYLASPIRTETRSAEDKKVDEFLDSTYKEKVSKDIRERNREAKLLISNNVPTNPGQSHKKKTMQDIVQGVFDFTTTLPKVHAIQILLPARKEKCQEISDVLQTIAHLYEKACNAENETLKANQAEILCLYNYFKEFYFQVKEIMRADQIGEKKAKGIIYNFIIKQIPGTKRENLYKKTYRAKKIHELFEKIGVDKIKYIKTYSANSISELTNDKIQTIIDYFSKNPNTELSDGRDEFIDDSSDVLTEAEVCEETLMETEVSITTTPFIKSYHNSNSEDIVNENNEFSETVTIIDSFSDSSESSDGDGGESSDDDSNNDETNSKDSTKVNTPTHNRTYFRNKMTEQYSDLFWEGGNGNNDYYGITNESLCLLCKSDHYEDKGIEGRYKSGSYFIKCE
ncbi:10415_t:CDS:2 [Gigaspora rosea]|nr:10415_t:CDS:2 [Gigaspora rosea]